MVRIVHQKMSAVPRLSLFVVLVVMLYEGASFGVNAAGEFCTKDSYHRCANGICVLNQWVCDGDNDCGDYSDELGCAPVQCLAGEGQFECTNRMCIPQSWRCDGDSDCEDHSDEQGCANLSCPDGQFSCGVNISSQCVPLQWVCDGHADCPSGLDEASCKNATCAGDEHQCSDGQCINQRWLCDGDIDCKDRSDERNCEVAASCPADQWQCNNTQCIPATWRCDDSFDCRDRSDEVNCPGSKSKEGRGSNECHPEEFQCRTGGQCIHRTWVCDIDRDCEDGSDEEECGPVTCLPHYFKCHHDDICIPEHLRCDGIDQCGDNSDELECTDKDHDECHELTEFDCTSMASDNCISLAAVCNGVRNCRGGEDENNTLCAGNYNHTSGCLNNECSHECVSTYKGHYCNCPHGFELDELDHKTCNDINECSQPGYCSQLCVNSIGGYKCGCHSGYYLDPEDHTTCRAITGEPTLLFANRHDLRQLHIYSGRYRLVVNGMHSAIAIDYDYENKVVFWTDNTSENISRIILDESGTPIHHEVLVSDDIHTPDGLAFDWIHKNLYWTDAGRDCIEVLGMYADGGKEKVLRKTLINTGLDEPRAIVVDPRHKYRLMYWTDWGQVPKIERANMDGTDRRTIVSENILWPNGLTLDLENNRLFWVDAKLHVIFSSDFGGQNRQVLLTSYRHLQHPFSIAVFENDVYWTDWQKQMIYKVSRAHGHNTSDVHVESVADNLLAPMDIRIHHTLKQPREPSACINRCSHLCLATPHYPGYTCACPNDQNGITYALDAAKLNCVVVVDKKIPVWPSDGSSDSVTTAVNEEHPAERSEPTRQGSNSLIIALSVTVVVIVTIIIAAALFVYYRYRQRNVKTMNFDNPVYRKTTTGEDALSLDKQNYQPPFQTSSSRRLQSPLLQPLTSTSSDSSPSLLV